MGKVLNAALEYRDLGFSILPIQVDKRPYVAWERFQREKPDPELIKEWWKKYPNANVGIVTGEISGLDVVDVDSEEAMATLDELLPDSLETPMSKTPRGGRHYYFQSMNGLTNSTGFIKHCDLRATGGYIIAPPSNGYSWLENLSIFEVSPALLPDAVLKAIKSTKGSQDNNGRHIDFSEGTRDETLFHTALSLLKGGMPREEVEKVIISLGATCNPPFPAKEAFLKIESAVKRLQTGGRNLTQEIREWIEINPGEFLTRNIFEELNVAPDKKGTVSKILKRLTEETLIERAGRRTGCFRRIENELVRMNILKSKKETVNLKMPFGIDGMIKLMPGNVIVLAGSKNAGKTAFLLNIVKDNWNEFNFHYFNSEMGEDEMDLRLELFDDTPPQDWEKANFYERDENFQDVIVPGKGNVNIIDYLEIYDDFWQIRERIAEIWRKLDGAVAIVAIQKPRNRDIGIGGEGSIEKARLALSMDSGMLKIVTAKNWKGGENPNGKQIKFKIVQGCKLLQVDNWSLD